MTNFFKKNVAPPILVFIIFIIVWAGTVEFLNIPSYILPSPGKIYQVALQNSGILLTGAYLTGLAALIGLLMSLLLGVIISFLFAEFIIIRYSFYPYAIFLQTVPIIAIAPLIVIWFGSGIQSVMIVSFIMSLFPIITNCTTGLISIEPELLELFQVNKATRIQLLLKLRLPHSIPYLVAGTKISSGLCVIGAIVGEFFAGYTTNHHGLGYIITLSSGQMKIDYLFSAVFMSTLLSLLFFYTVSFIGNFILNYPLRRTLKILYAKKKAQCLALIKKLFAKINFL